MITREEFMEFFRSDAYSELLTPDDKCEIFVGCLAGSSDVTKEIFDEVLSNYGVSNLEVIEIEES